MNITLTEIWKFSIPMEPFTIATATMEYAQNIFIRVHTDEGIYGAGECSAFPSIVGETQATCFELAKDFASIWKGKDPLALEERMISLEQYCPGNPTIQSAFDMALHDLAARKAGLPLYRFLGGGKKEMETDLTIGIGTPADMALAARRYIDKGVRILKIKLGKNGPEDVERIRRIREMVGPGPRIRIDANQGWTFPEAQSALQAMAGFDIQFCEQPMRTLQDRLLPELRKTTSIPIMADESAFNQADAVRLIESGSCDLVNIKLAKSGGILEARRIHDACRERKVPCMLGGMLESRIALTAFGHLAMACDNVVFYDLDTCLLGHRVDPAIGGIRFRGYFLEIPDEPGIGADAQDSFLAHCERAAI